MIDRRTFIAGAALLTATPAISALLPASSMRQSHASVISEALPLQTDPVVITIAGWNLYDGIALDQSSTNPIAKDSTPNQVLIRLDRSWRTSWR